MPITYPIRRERIYGAEENSLKFQAKVGTSVDIDAGDICLVAATGLVTKYTGNAAAFTRAGICLSTSRQTGRAGLPADYSDRDTVTVGRFTDNVFIEATFAGAFVAANHMNADMDVAWSTLTTTTATNGKPNVPAFTVLTTTVNPSFRILELAEGEGGDTNVRVLGVILAGKRV